VVGQIGSPDEGGVSDTSRELRVWPQQKLLIVMNFQCSAILHACASSADAQGSQASNFKFYDLTDPAKPALVATYTPTQTPHEMFLWADPSNPDRALLYWTSPTTSTSATTYNLFVTDLSGARQGTFTDVLRYNPESKFASTVRSARDVRLHSIAVSPAGTRTYLAYLGGGFLVLDTSQLAAGAVSPQVTLLTPTANSPTWPNMTDHSSVPIPNSHYALTTDEVYGDYLDPIERPKNEFGCPWGWVHIVDIADPAHPTIVGEFKTYENEASYCTSTAGQDPANTFFTAYSAHNPTVLPKLALVTWHSDGLEAIDLADPTNPQQAGFYSPTPLPAVVTEDPALSAGESKVVAWSYPIIHDGLIYFIDVRNGLYIVRYTGAHHEDVDGISFYEGNSNLGDALRLDTPDPAPTP
jgi:hypothetical protein